MSGSRITTASCSGIVEWRLGQLLAAGFAADLATSLAADRDVDLHAMLALIDRGCSPELAVRIQAPLAGTDRWSQ